MTFVKECETGITDFGDLYGHFIWLKYTHLVVSILILAYQYAKLMNQMVVQAVTGVMFPSLYFVIAIWKTNKEMHATFIKKVGIPRE